MIVIGLHSRLDSFHNPTNESEHDVSMPKPTSPPPVAPKAARPFHEVATEAQIAAHNDALRALADKFAKKHNNAKADEAKAGKSNNGFDAAPTTGKVDWAKQEALKTGTANVQLPSQTHGKGGRS